MKKIYKILAFFIFIITSSFLFVSCLEDDSVKISEIKMSETANNEIEIGNFVFENYEIIVSYSDGSSKNVALTKEMISDEDYLKTFNEGTNTIKITYEDYSFDYEINVKKYSFANEVYFVDTEVTYDGLPHSLEVEGNIPKGTTIIYPAGNTYTEAKTYTITAVVANDLYVTKTITGKLTIKKAIYDISNIVFEDQSFVYDGTAKSIAVKNAPSDLQVTYTNNLELAEMINANEYVVTAHFDAGNNYEKIPDMSATLTITKATYDMSYYKFSDKSYTYNGEVHKLAITNEDKLPLGVSVIYENNENVNAGTYEVVARFVGDSVNYEAIESKTATLTINKASYSLNGVYLDSESFVYDGKPHSVFYKGVLPSGVSFEGYENNGQINCGTYTVLAKFAYRDSFNYLPITPISGILEITQTDITSVVFKDKEVQYNGKGYTITAENVPAGVAVKYKIERLETDGAGKETYVSMLESSAKEPGTYRVTASFTFDEVASNNYYALADKTANLVITKKSLQSGFVSKEVTYDGQVHTLECDYSESYITVKYYYYNIDHEYVEFTGATEPGSYLVYAEFALDDSVNEEDFLEHYQPLTTESNTLTIKRVDFTPTYTNRVLQYTGSTLEVKFDESVLAYNPNLSFSAISYTNNRNKEVGIYRATVKFVLDDTAKKYYNEIPEQSFLYVILTDKNKAEEEVDPVFDYSTVVYDGNEHSISVSNVPEGINVTYQNNSQVLPGNHTVTVIFTYEDPIYKKYYDLPVGKGTYYEVAGDSDRVYCTVAFVIEKKLYNVKYTNNINIPYDGTPKGIELLDSSGWVSATFEYELPDSERIVPGTYKVTCKPEIINQTASIIYKVVEETLTFNIVKADPEVSYENLTVYYDGNPHKIKVNVTDGFEVVISGDNKTKVGIYPVDITFVNNKPDLYNDIEPQQETLTILSNIVSTEGFITYMNSSGNKYINQFVSLKEFIGSWLDLKAFKVDFEIDYFKKQDEGFPMDDSVRHGSSKVLDDFTFTESTKNDEYVIVSMKLTLKEGYEVVDGSMIKTFSSISTFNVGQNIEVDISKLKENFYGSVDVKQGDSLIKIFNDSIVGFESAELEYVADYYNGSNKFETSDSHKESKTKEDYIFNTSTYGNTTCNVTYTLTVPEGYSIFDGTRSYKTFTTTTKVSVEPISEVDVTYFRNDLPSSISVDQYSKLSESIGYLVDDRHLDVSWYINDSINSNTDYIIKNTDSFEVTITVKPTDKYSFKDYTDESITRKVTVNVNAKEAIDFTSFEAAMEASTQKKIYQYYDYFKDVVYGISMPSDVDYIITIYDTDGRVYTSENFESFVLSNYSTDSRKFKVEYNFYSSGNKLVVDASGYKVDNRIFTFTYDITKVIVIDTTTMDSKASKLQNMSVKQYSKYSALFGYDINTEFGGIDGATYQYYIEYQNVTKYGVTSLLLEGPFDNDLDEYIFSKLTVNVGGTDMSYDRIQIIVDIKLPSTAGYIFTPEAPYIKEYSFYITSINEINVINSLIPTTGFDVQVYQYEVFSNIVSRVSIEHASRSYWEVIDEDGVIRGTSYTNISFGTGNKNYKAKVYFQTETGWYYVSNEEAKTEFVLEYNITVVPRYTVYYNSNNSFTGNMITQRFTLFADLIKKTFGQSLVISDVFKSDDPSGNYDEYIYATSWTATYMSGSLVTRVVNGNMNSPLAAGVDYGEDFIILTVNYSLSSSSYIFSNYTGAAGSGATYSVNYKICVAYSAWKEVDIKQSVDFWNNGYQTYYLVSGNPASAYLDFGLSNAISIGYVQLTSYEIRKVETGTLLENYVPTNYSLDSDDLYYYRMVYEIPSTLSYYFFIDSNGQAVRTYTVNAYKMCAKRAVFDDDGFNSQIANYGINGKVGDYVFTSSLTEERNGIIKYKYIVSYSSNSAYSQSFTTYKNVKTFYISGGSSTQASSYRFTISLKISISDTTADYCIVMKSNELIGYSNYSLSYTTNVKTS